MRQFNILAAVGLLASSVSAAVLPRDDCAFHVTGFYYSGTPHSLYETAQLSVNGSNFATTYCIASLSIFGTLPPVPETACADPTVSFSIDINGTAAALHVNHKIGTEYVDTRTKIFPESSVQYSQNPANPNGNYYYLSTGSSDFDMPA